MDHWLKQDVRVDAAFGNSELALPHLLEEDLPDGFRSARTLLVVGGGILGEQVCEVVPQAELDVVPVRVLQALDGANGLDVFDVSLRRAALASRAACESAWRAPSESAPIASTPIGRNVQRIAAFYLRSAWSSIVGIV